MTQPVQRRANFTTTHFRDARRDVALAKSKLERTLSELKNAYGPDHRLVIRAEDAVQALQRFEFELDRAES